MTLFLLQRITWETLKKRHSLFLSLQAIAFSKAFILTDLNKIESKAYKANYCFSFGWTSKSIYLAMFCCFNITHSLSNTKDLHVSYFVWNQKSKKVHLEQWWQPFFFIPIIHSNIRRPYDFSIFSWLIRIKPKFIIRFLKILFTQN